MRERRHCRNLTSQLYLSGSSVCQFKWKKAHSGGEGGVLRTSDNGHSEKTVTFSFCMAFKAQT